ncbi:MAG: M1 family metallopeptidase [Bacteroidota bacterium]
MLKHIYLLLVVLWVTAAVGYAQTEEYFQQTVDYNIRVRLDDQKHFLHAQMRLDYQNNSPDTLDTLYLHLWPNAYKDNTTAFARQKRASGSRSFIEAKPIQRGYIDSLDLRIDGTPTPLTYWNNNWDIAAIALPDPLLPGEKLRLETPFRVKIPLSWSRLGHVNQQYQLCQWYPKPAVYDRNGWNPMPYLDQGEFYSEFGSFDVYIEVPKNYVVGATGDLPADDPEWEWLAQREAQSRKMLQSESDTTFVHEFSADEYKTLHFHQEKVHDFAWFCDQTYYVLADTVQLPRSGLEVRCVAMFTNLDRDLWRSAPRYIVQSVGDYSAWNGDYPYRHATAVDGALSAGAGMEYPNITVLGAGGSARALERVIMHEVGHNWFYGILGSDERTHPWMDEGINSYFENRYWEKWHNGKVSQVPDVVGKLLGVDIDDNFVGREGYRLLSADGIDQPIEFPSADYVPINYGLIVYQKSAQAFRYLEAYLGRATVDKCFRAYYARWRFRHPQPADMQRVFEEISGKDLGWFFGEYIRGTEQLDFRIRKVKGNVVTLENKRAIRLPASVALVDKNGAVQATVWSEPFTGTTEIELPESKAKFLEIDPQRAIPEFRTNNNRLRRTGLFKRARPLRIGLGYQYPDPNRFTLNLLPVAGFNTTDGFMLGLLVHHGTFPRKRFGFDLMPMYGFRSNNLTGSAGFALRWSHKGPFRKITLRNRTSSFSTFLRNRTSLDFTLVTDNRRSPWRHSFGLVSQTVAVRTDSLELGLLPEDWYLPVYGALTWRTQYEGLYDRLLVEGEIGGNASERLYRLSADVRYARRLGKRMRLDMRGFLGGIIAPNAAPFLLQYRVSGSADPFGERALLDRAENSNVLGNQVVPDHGGFSSLTGASFDRGLFAANVHFKLPIPLLGVFGDVAYGLGSQSIPNAGFWDAGVRVTLLPGVFHLNFPIAGTAFSGLPADAGTFVRGINFVLDFGRLRQLGDLAELL